MLQGVIEFFLLPVSKVRCLGDVSYITLHHYITSTLFIVDLSKKWGSGGQSLDSGSGGRSPQEAGGILLFAKHYFDHALPLSANFFTEFDVATVETAWQLNSVTVKLVLSCSPSLNRAIFWINNQKTE